MKTCSKLNLGGLISERLAAIGASNIPAGARAVIEADVWRACERTVQRFVTGPRVGKAVSRALTGEGCKGATAPLPSRCDAPEAQNIVAGPDTDSANQEGV